MASLKDLLAELGGIKTAVQSASEKQEARLSALEARVKKWEDAEVAPERSRRQLPPDFLSGVEGKDSKGAYKFSFARAFYAAATKDWSRAGYEHEAIKQTQKALEASNSESVGFIAPPTVASELIPLLRSKWILDKLGVRFLYGLVGSAFEQPRQTGAASGYWIGEQGGSSSTGITPSDQKTDLMRLRPHTCGALTKYSARLLAIGSPEVEQFVRDDLTEVLARTIQTAFFAGIGAGGQPLGVMKFPGIKVVQFGAGPAGAAPTVAALQSLQEEIEAANGDLGELKWVMNPRAKSRIARIRRPDSNTPILKPNSGEAEGDAGTLLGHKYYHTTDIPLDTVNSSTDIALAAWMQTLLAMWNTIEIEASNSAGDAFEKRMIWVRATQDVDFNMAHEESLCLGQYLGYATAV